MDLNNLILSGALSVDTQNFSVPDTVRDAMIGVIEGLGKDMALVSAGAIATKLHNHVSALMREESDQVVPNGEGDLFDQSVNVPMLDQGTTDNYKLRCGISSEGMSIIVSSNQWHLIHADKIQSVWERVRAKSGYRYGEDIHNWLDKALRGDDTEFLTELLIGTCVHGARDPDNPIFAASEEMVRHSGITEFTKLGEVTPARASIVLASSVNSVPSGEALFLNIKVTMSLAMATTLHDADKNTTLSEKDRAASVDHWRKRNSQYTAGE